MTDPRRALPAVGTLLDLAAVQQLLENAPRTLVTDAVRGAIDDARVAPGAAPTSDDGWAAAVARRLATAQMASLRPVVNGTGVVLHTNLGRAPLASVALEAVQRVAGGFSNLEYDVDAGARGSRHTHCASLLVELTGSEDAMVVNNCAAAVVLALNTFADGKEAIISRGELVEIGGSFRVPDIMTKSGARLVEVGTTNRTHADDYRRALTEQSGAIVSVHRSNFTIEGFVASVPTGELVAIADAASVPLLHDFGSGLMIDLSPWGLSGEPTARDAVADGASVVMMSGDKLFGGPQAGIILGKRSMIAALRQNPLARALRVDKMTLAALEATLMLYRDPARAVRDIPALAMLTATVASLAERAGVIVSALAARGISAAVAETESTVGGGAFPSARIASAAVALGGPPGTSASAVEARLRSAPVPVIARVSSGRVLVDLRGVAPAFDSELTTLLVNALG